MKIETSLYDLGRKFVDLGLAEIPGEVDNGFISWAHSLCKLGHDVPETVPWCSSWLNALCLLLGLERSGSAAARSWLAVGTVVEAEAWERGDVIVLKRGEGQQPGPSVIAAPGHVGILADVYGDGFQVLGGNQNDRVSVNFFANHRLLGLRRLQLAP